MDKNFKFQRLIISLIYLVVFVAGMILLFIYRENIGVVYKFLWLFLCGWLGTTIRSFSLIRYPSSPWFAYLIQYPISLFAICSIVYFLSILSSLEETNFYIVFSFPCIFFGFFIHKSLETISNMCKIK